MQQPWLSHVLSSLSSCVQPVRTFTAPAFFTFHYVNAFESADGQSLHLDMGMYDGPEVMNDLYLDRLAAYPGGQQRWWGSRCGSVM
jgi:carotenoid cleavage dioxygenase-like enzyme